VFSGAEAIDRAGAFQPWMVVLDINMPGLDGFETAKRLKQQVWARDAIFVAHTGMRRGLGTSEFAGFDHVVIKGDGPEVFESIIAQFRVR
jgi:CheY-like chemotaxis protein